MSQFLTPNLCLQVRAKWGHSSVSVPIEEHGVFPMDCIVDIRDVHKGKFGGKASGMGTVAGVCQYLPCTTVPQERVST